MDGEGSQKSSLTGWVLAIVRAMRTCGIDTDAVLADVGMDAALLEGGYSRYSQEQLSALWLRAIELSGDEAFTLLVAGQVRPATFHVLGYAMSCSATLSRALSRFSRYCRLVSDACTAILTENGETVTLEFLFDTGGTPLIHQTVDTVVASVLAYARWISGEPIVPVAIHLRHSRPKSHEAYLAFFRSPIFYNTNQTCIVFNRSDLDRHILVADEELASMLDKVADEYLDRRMSGRMAVRVRDLLIASLPNDPASKANVARALNLTERTLLRRLKMEGTTFVDVLNGVRQELAFQYLRRPGVTVSDAAYMLGFSDENTFSRAFKRWTGRRPGAMLAGQKRSAEAATGA